MSLVEQGACLSTKVRAAVCREFGGALQIEMIRLAEPGPEQVRVRLHATAICHSDISLVRGRWGGTLLPMVAGHEGAGVVEAVGEQVQGLAVGDKVVVTLVRACGQCAACRIDHPVSCDQMLFSAERSPLTDAQNGLLHQGLATAAFAEACVVHQSQLVKYQHSVAFEYAALLGCGVITGYCSVSNVAQLPKRQKVVVIGVGGLGLNTIQAAAAQRAWPLVAVDVLENKLQAGLEFGATHAVNATSNDVVEQVMEICAGPADYVFVTAGSAEMFSASLDMLSKYGTSVIVGMPADNEKVFAVDAHKLTDGRRLLGSKMGDVRIQRDIPKLLDRHQEGALKLAELISKCYPLEEINEAIADVEAGRALRNVIRF